MTEMIGGTDVLYVF